MQLPHQRLLPTLKLDGKGRLIVADALELLAKTQVLANAAGALRQVDRATTCLQFGGSLEDSYLVARKLCCTGEG
jgi:hypothetical protein